MKSLSIIVPIYNVEPYVERCIRSLENQDIPKDDYEIICINDGSTDDSRSVILRLKDEFDNVILIDQENQGVSVARNAGIDIARGKYLLMVDADDYIKPNSQQKRLHFLNKHNIDVGYTGIIIHDAVEQDACCSDISNERNIILTGIDFINKYRRGKSEIQLPHSSCSIFLKTSFLDLNNLRYLKRVPYLEDREFMARVICLATRVAFLNDPFYLRTTRPGSATQSNLALSEKARDGFLKAAYNLLNFKLNYCKGKEQKIFMNQPIVHFTLLYITSYGSIKYFKNYSKIYKTLKKGPLKNLETEGCSKFYRKMGNSYNKSIHCYYLRWILFRLLRSMEIKWNRITSSKHKI